MTLGSDWITLATCPPHTQEEMETLDQALKGAAIETELEENLVRQCENDPAFWLRVRSHELPLAWELARKLSIIPSKD